MYYLIGIKGSGMAALASFLFDLGYKVSGSDVDKYFFTQEGLDKRGIVINDYDAKYIKDGMIIIKGNSIKDDNVQLQKALELNLRIYTYQNVLSQLCDMFKTITVAGCHGKTSTTSLLSHILGNIVGANYIIGDGSGFASKENKYFVLEACEYKRHFLEYHPYYAIITNIELDHVDYYKDIDDVIDAYTSYANNALKMVIACGDDKYTRYLNVNKPIFYYGLNDSNDIIAKNVVYSKSGIVFDVFVEDNYYGHFDLPIYGKHQLLNALASIGVCYYERMNVKKVAKAIKSFKGAKRRFTITKLGNNIVIDDYAHHPTEMRATIKAAKQKYPDKKIVVVFQPHTFTRTLAFKDNYIRILKRVNKVYILPIHGARESEELISHEDLIREIPGSYSISMDEPEALLKYDNAVIIFMSPNDISELKNAYIKLKE